MNKSLKNVLKVAEKNGARIVTGRNHIKIYDGSELLGVLPHGHNRDRVPGGCDKMFRKKFAARGWTV
jgi:hypothetical protein